MTSGPINQTARRVALFDPFSGASGDMILGALVGAGLDPDRLREILAGLPLGSYRIEVNPLVEGGIASTRVEVICEGRAGSRTLEEVLEVLDAGALSQPVRDRAEKIFRRLAEAEARVHGTRAEEVHFHEVGAVDAIVDVVGAVAGLAELAVDEVVFLPFRLGRGEVVTAHGRFPVPAPATLELLTGFPVLQTEVEAELTTPTGAAILSTLGRPWPSGSELVVESISYGAGSRRSPERPNLLRLMTGWIGEPAEELHLMETDLDDLDPRILPQVEEVLRQVGVVDVHRMAVHMKKGRSGSTLRLLVPASRLGEAAQCLFRETTTIGVRHWPVGRLVLPREAEEAETPWGTVRVKRVHLPDGTMRRYPEYEDCRRLAEERGIPLVELLHALAAHLADAGDLGVR